MIEYHGWITISESYSDNPSNELMRSIWNNLIVKVDEISVSSDISTKLDIINGQCHFTFFGNANHGKSSSWKNIYGLIEWITKHAVGSYGIIYLHDDEILNLENEFIIFCIKKGKIFQIQDRLLSPIIPEIEDE